MLRLWLSSNEHVSIIAEDAKVLTLNVLATTLFGASAGSTNEDMSMSSDPSSPYGASIRTMLYNAIPILVFGEMYLRCWWMPTTMRRAGVEIPAFRNFVKSMIYEVRTDIANGKRTQQNLVASLVQACEVTNSGRRFQRQFLITENEINRNLFVYAVAGMDTTSITLSTAIIHLAAHPELQDWIADEVAHYSATGSITELGFDIFPKLKRCMAVMVSYLNADMIKQGETYMG